MSDITQSETSSPSHASDSSQIPANQRGEQNGRLVPIPAGGTTTRNDRSNAPDDVVRQKVNLPRGESISSENREALANLSTPKLPYPR